MRVMQDIARLRSGSRVTGPMVGHIAGRTGGPIVTRHLAATGLAHCAAVRSRVLTEPDTRTEADTPRTAHACTISLWANRPGTGMARQN
jgi:hypothetical protein